MIKMIPEARQSSNWIEIEYEVLSLDKVSGDRRGNVHLLFIEKSSINIRRTDKDEPRAVLCNTHNNAIYGLTVETYEEVKKRIIKD